MTPARDDRLEKLVRDQYATAAAIIDAMASTEVTEEGLRAMARHVRKSWPGWRDEIDLALRCLADK